MDVAEIDNDGYPTEETLTEIQKWPMERGFNNLMEFIEPCFERYGRLERRDIGGIYECATGGWSGCEDVM